MFSLNKLDYFNNVILNQKVLVLYLGKLKCLVIFRYFSTTTTTKWRGEKFSICHFTVLLLVLVISKNEKFVKKQRGNDGILSRIIYAKALLFCHEEILTATYGNRSTSLTIHHANTTCVTRVSDNRRKRKEVVINFVLCSPLPSRIFRSFLPNPSLSISSYIKISSLA